MRKRDDWLLAAAMVLMGGIASWANAQTTTPPPGIHLVPLPNIDPAPSHPPAPPSTVLGPRAAARGKQVYASEFAKGAGDQWSKKQVTKCPSGKRTFLGPFACESTTLSLDDLPEHARVRLSFDLMIMLTWDGDLHLDQPNKDGPDLFDVTVDRGPRLVHASFVGRPNSETNTQSFPGRFPYDHLPAGTAAAEARSLGYVWTGYGDGNGPDDYVYHIERSFAHSGKRLKIAYSGINLEAVDNECWGLDKVQVEVLPAAKAGAWDEAGFGKLWADVASADPKTFVPAIDSLIDLGEPGVAAIRKRIAPPSRTAEDIRIAKLIAQLDADAYMDREKATTVLRDLGVAAEPALREARENASSLEVRVRIDKLLDGLKRGSAESDGERRLRRLVEVLELAGGEQARAGLTDIAARTGSLAAWEAKAAILRFDGKAEIPNQLDLAPGLPKSNVAPPPQIIIMRGRPFGRRGPFMVPQQR
jgi:hypothetical protein